MKIIFCNYYFSVQKLSSHVCLRVISKSSPGSQIQPTNNLKFRRQYPRAASRDFFTKAMQAFKGNPEDRDKSILTATSFYRFQFLELFSSQFHDPTDSDFLINALFLTLPKPKVPTEQLQWSKWQWCWTN